MQPRLAYALHTDAPRPFCPAVASQPLMYSRLIAVLVTGVALISAAAEIQNQKAPTLDELVAKNIQAKGGADALHALQSLKVTGKMLINEGQIQLTYTEIKKRPGEVRTEESLQGSTAIDDDNGKEGWRSFPFQER